VQGNVEDTNGEGDLSNKKDGSVGDELPKRTGKQLKTDTPNININNPIEGLQAPRKDRQSSSFVANSQGPTPPVTGTVMTPYQLVSVKRPQSALVFDHQNEKPIDDDVADSHADFEQPVESIRNPLTSDYVPVQKLTSGKNVSPHKDEFKVEETVWRYIEEFHQKDLEEICGTAVQLNYNFQSGSLRIETTTMQPVADVSDKIISLCQRTSDEVGCKRSSYTRNIDDKSLQNDVKRYMERSRCILVTDTATGGCQIVGPRDTLETVNSGLLDLSQRFKFRTPGGIEVVALRNDLLYECVDAIVNPANSHLSHGSGAARAIADAAGSKLRTECADYITQHKRLRCTEVMHTTAGKMIPSIRYVIHASGPKKKDYSKNDELSTALLDTFYNCLYYANTHLKIKTLSIPAIGSGQLLTCMFIYIYIYISLFIYLFIYLHRNSPKRVA